VANPGEWWYKIGYLVGDGVFIWKILTKGKTGSRISNREAVTPIGAEEVIAVAST
jgi:hypothetical protein